MTEVTCKECQNCVTCQLYGANETQEMNTCITCQNCVECQIYGSGNSRPQGQMPTKPIGKQFMMPNQQMNQQKCSPNKGCDCGNQTQRKKISEITLWNTRKCNYHCKYCFVYELHKNQTPEDISDEVIKALPAFIKKEMNPNFSIWYFGGEPMMNYDGIQKVYNELTPVFGKNTIRWGMTSNLSLITEEKAKWLGKQKFNVLCSIDGIKEAQNKYRVLENDKGTFDLAMKGLANVRLFINKDPQIRMTVAPDNAQHVFESVKMFATMGYKSIAVEPVYEVDWKKEELKTYSEQLTLCADMISAMPQPIDIKPIQDMTQLFNRGDWKQRCGLGLSGIGMDTDGKAYTCFTEDTIVNIKDDYVKISEIVENDIVKTDKNRYKPVTKCFKRKYSGKIITVYPYLCTPITATPEHPFMVLKDDKIVWVTTEDLAKRENSRTPDYAVVSLIPQETEDIEYIKVNELLTGLFTSEKDEVIYLGSKKHLKNTLPIDSEFLFMIGWFIAEGSTSTDKNRNTDSNILAEHYAFALSLDERNIVEKIVRYLEKIGCSPSVYVDDKSNRITINEYHPVLASLLRYLCGEGAKNKQIPTFLMKLPPEKQIHLLGGILNGDGGKYKEKGYAFSTESMKLAYQIRELYLRQKIITRLKQYNRVHNYNGKSFTEYRILHYSGKNREAWIDGDKVFYKIWKTEEKNYDGFVYNLEVDEDNTYTANGIVVHNCHRFVATHDPELSIGDVFNGLDNKKIESFKKSYVHPVSEDGQERCDKCVWKMACIGSCLAANLDVTGSLSAVPRSYCDIISMYVETFIPKYLHLILPKIRPQQQMPNRI